MEEDIFQGTWKSMLQQVKLRVGTYYLKIKDFESYFL